MITIYGKEMCEYCDKAKEVCHQNSVEFKYFSIDDRFDGEASLADLRNRLIKANRSIKTVPVIWDGDQFIGGYNELLSYVETLK